MKYKNIELLVGEDGEAELSCSIEFDNINDDWDLTDDLTNELIELFDNFESSIDIEQYATNLIGIRCIGIGFNKAGVELLTKIYNKLSTADFSVNNSKVLIDVNIDNEEWFKREDGSEYNVDSVTLEEFLANVEY
jgi:hypothetical protein